MQLKTTLPALAMLLCASAVATPSAAGICTLLPLLGGALKLSGDGAVLGSETGGSTATFSIISIGASTVTVSAPTLGDYPSGHYPTDAVLEVAYRGSELLSSVVQPYTATTTQFSVPSILSAVVVTMNNRIRTSSGLATGHYQLKTVVTCG